MTNTAPLPSSLCRRILRHFGLPSQLPATVETLQLLVARYTRNVPWESANRIVRRANHVENEACFLTGEAFWESRFATGSGGTCYESNYAFWGLLRWLGYTGYLTLNDMGEHVGCHSAIVLRLAGQKWLVDVGFPLYTCIPIQAGQETVAECPFMQYRLAPQGGDSYLLRRENLPRAYSFTLRDQPVADDAYRAIGIHDYRHDGGQFLNEVVIHKVVAEQLWRFHSDPRPLCLQQFINGERRDQALGEDPAAELAAKFGIARDLLAEALELVGAKDYNGANSQESQARCRR
ncbi:MAG: arylamine N-acetyltransferase [Chloroflexi bacterium]|nr:arylamine N-acetyltransferase [Chloroflexota bacterium]